jgi:arginine deiminase
MRIDSEIGQLKRVIVHQDALALKRLTPNNCEALLFDDVLWPEKADEEHQVFQSILRENDVSVYLLDELLKETLDIPAARDWLIKKGTHRLYQNTELAAVLSDFLQSQSARTLADCFLGGLTWKEAELDSQNLASQVFGSHDFLLPPLPNHLFTRDTSCWINNGVSINPMHWPARQGETDNLAVIYRFHPMFDHDNANIWYDGSDEAHPLPSIEGGDVLVLNKHTLAIGLSERTTAYGIELLAKSLFADSDIQQILVIEIPKTRASMHLDTVMTMIHHDMFCMAFSEQNMRSWFLRPGDENEIVCEAQDNLIAALKHALDLKEITVITPGGDLFNQEREQWTDASNLLCIRPGTVIAYDRNIHTANKLKAHGITVLNIPGSELGRGRGGSRCMSCPILRDDV